MSSKFQKMPLIEEIDSEIKQSSKNNLEKPNPDKKKLFEAGDADSGIGSESQSNSSFSLFSDDVTSHADETLEQSEDSFSIFGNKSSQVKRKVMIEEIEMPEKTNRVQIEDVTSSKAGHGMLFYSIISLVEFEKWSWAKCAGFCLEIFWLTFVRM